MAGENGLLFPDSTKVNSRGHHVRGHCVGSASGARTRRMLSRTLSCAPVGGYHLTVLRDSFILFHEGGKGGRALLERQKIYAWVSATTREQVAFCVHALVAQSAEGGGARGDLTVLTMCKGLGATPTTPQLLHL